jgi:hypothetical protein
MIFNQEIKDTKDELFDIMKDEYIETPCVRVVRR